MEEESVPNLDIKVSADLQQLFELPPCIDIPAPEAGAPEAQSAPRWGNASNGGHLKRYPE